MKDHLRAVSAGDSIHPPEWQEALDKLERSLHEALRAIALLRRDLENGGAETAASNPVAPAAPARPPAPAPSSAGAAPTPENDSASTRTRAGLASFDRLWDRVERERTEQPAPEPEAQPERRGLASLPQGYLMTVEDREGKVDLIPLHRALSNLSNVQEISLASYANGVPVVSLRVEGEIDLQELDDVVSTAMDRECEVIPQDTGRIYLRMRARQ